ncbi:hypothetical protein D3C72_1261840 [compost metagenome]
MQQPTRAALRQLQIQPLRLGQQRFAVLQGHNGVDLRVERIDLRQVGMQHIHAGDVARMDGGGQRNTR